MKTITFLSCKTRISLFAILVGMLFTSSAFAATVTWNGLAGDGLWSSPTNWSSNLTPTAADNVVIPATFTVTLSSDAGKINKITVNGKLIVTTTGILNVEQTTSSDPLVDIAGGEIDNAGSLTIKQTIASNNNLAIKFSDGAAIANTKLTNSGVLTVDLTARATTSTTACISFAHVTANTKTAQFNLGGTINMNVLAQARVFELTSGNVILDGTYTFGSDSDYKNWRFIQTIAGNFTFASTADITLYAGYTLDNAGTIASSNSKEVVFTNNGKLTLHGGPALLGYGIFMNPQANTFNCTFTNNGTLTLDGSFPRGAIYMSGGAITATNTLNNQIGATLSIANSSTVSGAIVANATATLTNIINNAGTFSLNAGTSKSIYFGGSNSTFNNSGTVNVTKAITGNTTANTCVFNNNSGGVFNFNVSDNAQLAISNSNKINFKNNSGGIVNGRGLCGSGTFLPQDGSILSPGGDNGTGIFTFLDSNFILKGKCIMNINGTTAAGTDFDQVYTNQASSVLNVTNVNVETIIGAGYSPANLDIVPLFKSLGTVTGTFASVIAPSNWVSSYDASSGNLLYDTSTGIEKNVELNGQISVIGNQIIVNRTSTEMAQLQITDLSGRIVMKTTVKGDKNVFESANLKGIYIARLITAEGNYSQKILLK